MLNLYPFQEDIIEQLRAGFRAGHKRQMLAAATGSGKTVITSSVIHHAARKGNRSLFVVDRIELVGQASRHLEGMGLNVGVLQGDNTCLHPDDEVVVASIQTIRSRGIVPAALVVIDEAHVLHKAHIDLMKGWDKVPVVGLSATPLREDLGKYFSNLIRGPSIQQLIKDGYLVKPIVFCPHAADVQRLLSDVMVRQGEFVTSQLSEKLNSKTLIGDIIATWQVHASSLKTIVFCVDVAHSKAVCDDFLAIGVSAEQLDYRTASGDRREIIGRFRSGQTQVLTSVNILGTGFDVPDVGAAILARPTMSEALFIQQVGRALRIFPGKSEAIILDHAANTIRHGLPQDFEVPDLGAEDREQAERKKRIAQITPCHACGAVLEAGQETCPVCGTDRPVRKTEVDYQDGELVKYGSGELAANASQEEKRHWYAGLKGCGEMRGYADGWAYHKFAEKFGHKPSNAWRNTASKPPSQEMLRWVKSRQIAWAKSMRNKH